MTDDFKPDEIRDLRLIGIFKEKVETPISAYGSSNVIFYATPVMLLQDYENQRIRGVSYKKIMRLFRNKDGMRSKIPLDARWQLYGENNKVIKVSEYIAPTDYKILDSLKKGNAFTFEAKLSFFYAKADGLNFIKSPMLFDIKNVQKYKEQGISKKMKRLINKAAW